MKIVAISDTHNAHMGVNLPEGDLLIHAGDATMMGAAAETGRFIKWFTGLPYKHKVFVPGNHDFMFFNQLPLCQEMMGTAHILVDRLIEVEGIKIYGSPWTPEYGGWAFMRERGEEMKRTWSNIPHNIDVLVTHGPPQGILDGGLGDEALYPRSLLEIKPSLHIFGHIHREGGKQEQIGQTLFVNVAQLDDQYVDNFKPWAAAAKRTKEGRLSFLTPAKKTNKPNEP